MKRIVSTALGRRPPLNLSAYPVNISQNIGYALYSYSYVYMYWMFAFYL